MAQPDTPLDSRSNSATHLARPGGRVGTLPVVAPSAPEAPAAAGDGAAPVDPRIGSLIAERYRLIEQVGEGGMGAVYRGEHVSLRKRVAVKFLHPELSRITDVIARFEREAIAAANLEHPNVVAAHDFGKTDDGQFFLVMEYVEGPSIRSVLDSGGRLEPERALKIARHIAAALHRAHAMGIVHRDLKPDNVVLVEREGDADFAKVLDFGIAKVGSATLGGAAKPLTQAGMVFGTPDYMAPEQALGATVDARADQYAFGVMVFEMFTGKRPFESDDVMVLLSKHMTAPPPTASSIVGPGVLPDEVDGILARMLAKSANDRFPAVSDAMHALDAAFGITPGSLGTPPHGIRLPAPEPVAAKELAPSPPAPGADRGAPGPQATVRTAMTTLITGYARLRADPRRFRVALIVVAGVLLALIVIVSSVGFRRAAPPSAPAAPAVSPTPTSRRPPVTPLRLALPSHPAGATTAPTRNPTAPAAPTAPSSGTSLDAQIAAYRERPAIAALLAIAHGRNLRAVTAAFEHLRSQTPEDAVLAYLLGTLYAQQRNAGALAIERYGDAMRLQPAFANDRTLQYDVARVYASARRLPAGAEALLTGPLAAAIFEPLVTAGLETNSAAGRERVRALLQTPPFSSRAGVGLMALFDLQRARSCLDKRPVVETLGREGDARALPYLRRIRVGQGCGFLGMGECNPCLAAVLPAAIASIEQRTPSAGR